MTDVSYAYTGHLVTLHCIKHLEESSPVNQPDSAAVNWVHKGKSGNKKPSNQAKTGQKPAKISQLPWENSQNFSSSSPCATLFAPLKHGQFSAHRPVLGRRASVVALTVGE